MQISKGTTKFILIAIGLMIFLAGYFLVYIDFTNKTDETLADIDTLSDRLDELENYNAQIDNYETSIAENRTFIDTNLLKYYSMETPEDFIVLSQSMVDDIGISVPHITFDDPETIAPVTGFANTDDAADLPPEPLELMCYRLSATFTAEMTYEQMKTALKTIYKQQDVTKLQTLTLSYDPTSGLISSSITLDKYYLTGRGIDDHEAPLPHFDLGTDALMGG